MVARCGCSACTWAYLWRVRLLDALSAGDHGSAASSLAMLGGLCGVW
ncbi:hypothetical protein ACW910_16090 (plasmid) [Burkholderia ambifaria]